jgi:hypothetical protein
MKILDEEDNVIDEMLSLPHVLKPAAIFEYSKLLVGKPKAVGFRMTVVDPNQNS